MQIEVYVAAAVVLEGALRAVGAEAVGLDHEPLVSPQEVGLVAVQGDVDLGVRESGGARDGEEGLLESLRVTVGMRCLLIRARRTRVGRRSRG